MTKRTPLVKPIQEPNKGIFETIFLKVAPLLIFIAAALLVFLIFQLGKTSKAVTETSAYTRVSNCILGKSANPPFTQEEIEKCYIQVEKDTGVQLERFDRQLRNEN